MSFTPYPASLYYEEEIMALEKQRDKLLHDFQIGGGDMEKLKIEVFKIDKEINRLRREMDKQ